MSARTVKLPEEEHEIKWFIEGEPGNEPTNEALAREIPAEYFHRDKLCADGKEHNLWECPLFSTIKRFIKFRETETFVRFSVWMQMDGGAIQRWKLTDKQRRGAALGRKRKIRKASELSKNPA